MHGLIPNVKTKTLDIFRTKIENLIFTKPLRWIAVLDVETTLPEKNLRICRIQLIIVYTRERMK